MKRLYIRYFVPAMFAIGMFACDDRELATMNSTATIAPQVSSEDIILTEENAASEVLEISWTKPDYGFSASPAYYVYLDNDADFSSPLILNNGGETTLSLTGEALNRHLLGMEYETEVEAPLYVKVESRLSNFSTLMSEPMTLSVTPYSAFLDLTTPWGVVGSAYNNWGAFPDAPFFQSTSNSSTIIAYVELMDGFIKFRQNNAWDVNFGDNGNDGTLEQNGSDIPVDAGRYKISWNTANNTYTIEQFSWGIVGSAYNNWGADGPDFPFTYDDATDQWRAVVALKDGAFKIRKNNDWGLNYGDNGADGTLEEGGADINITAGKYLLTFNDQDLTLTIEAIPNIWGLVGSAYNDWGGGGPDAQFQPDWRNEGIWILRNVTLLDGAYKFRDNNDWGLNYGDTGADGSLEQNGADITSQAGIYTITLDFTNPASPTWSSIKH